MQVLEGPKVEQKETLQAHEALNHLLKSLIERTTADATKALDEYSLAIDIESNTKIEEALREARSIVHKCLRDIRQAGQRVYPQPSA